MICPVCKSKSISEFKKVKNYILNKCFNCKIVFLKNPENDLKTLYGEVYFSNYLYESDLNHESFLNSAKYYSDLITQKFGKFKSILEVGSGFGLFFRAFKELGYEAIGLEPSSYSVKIAREKFGIELLNQELTSFSPDKKFDLILFYHSFEHIPNPVETLLKAKSLLNSKGILWISLPNVISLDRFIHKENWNGWSLPYHLFHYSPSSIKNLLKICGFKAIYIQKSFLNPLRIFKADSKISQKVHSQTQYSRLKELIRKPATLIFSGQNMNVFARVVK